MLLPSITQVKWIVARSALPWRPAYLVCLPLEIAATLVRANTASAIVVEACVAGTALGTRVGTGDGVGEALAWTVTSLAADFIVAVCRAAKCCWRII